MVLLEDEDYRDLKSGADKSEQLEKEMLALQILARQKDEEAAAAKAEIGRLKREAARLLEDNKILMEHYALSRHRQFGASSEKTPISQEQMLFDEAEACASPDALEPEISVSAHTRIKKTRGKREIDLSKLLLEERHYELEGDKCLCPKCRAKMHRIGEEVRSEVKFVPGHMVHVKHIRGIFACRPCDRNETSTPIITAPMPKPAFPKSLASASMVAYIMFRKYVEGLPLYRQEQQFRRTGVLLSRQNLANWVIAGAVWLEHIFKALHATLLEQDIAHADETVLQVLREAGRAAQTESRMWLYSSGRYSYPIRLFEYQMTRSGEHPRKFLAGFSGYLHVDAYSAYKTLPDVRLAGCLAHARRKYTDIIKILPSALQKNGNTPAHAGRNFINKLFDIERDLKDATPDERHAARQVRSRNALDLYRAWLDTMVTETNESGKLGEAIRYSINQWENLIRFLDDGRLEIDNNRAERSIKPFVIGRNAWMFANTPAGARASAIVYSIVETAKENGLDPFVYLTHLFEQLPNIDLNDKAAIEKLLPWTEDIQGRCRAKATMPKTA
jgi:transposase